VHTNVEKTKIMEFGIITEETSCWKCGEFVYFGSEIACNNDCFRWENGRWKWKKWKLQ